MRLGQSPPLRRTGHKRHWRCAPTTSMPWRSAQPELRSAVLAKVVHAAGSLCPCRSDVALGPAEKGNVRRRAAMMRRVLLARRWYSRASPESRAARGRGSLGLLMAGVDLVRSVRWAGDCRCAGAAVVGLGFRGEWGGGGRGGPHGSLGRARGRGEQRAEMLMVTLVSQGPTSALNSWSGCKLGWPRCRGPSAPLQNAVERGIPGGLVPPAGRASSGAVSWSTSSRCPGGVLGWGPCRGLEGSRAPRPRCEVEAANLSIAGAGARGAPMKASIPMAWPLPDAVVAKGGA